MKKIRVVIVYVLLLSMLLSSLSGMVYAAGQLVSLGEQLVFDPLAETESVAYERHGNGYEVALNCSADSVTMDVTAVPAAPKAEQAVLYIRTGVTLKAGATYRVGYTLTANQTAEYSVCFDGAAEDAYGAKENRTVAAGGTDMARFFLTPKTADGELILRLQLGKTPINTFRLSDLTVEEATQDEIATGADTVLVDGLDYNAPGFIRYWTNEDCGATLTSDGKSSTLTVTKVGSQKEVWKIKLLVATGLIPEAGKAYRFRADVNSSATHQYEVCYNEGETEKGYDVLYNQTLKMGMQTLDRTIYVTQDKKNPGELVVQLSLGLLQLGDKVTISNVRLEEVSATYESVLAKDFAFDKAKWYDNRTYAEGVVSRGNTDLAAVNWASRAAVTRSGDKVGELTVDRANATAALKINQGVNSWDARFNFDTGATLDANSTYRADVTVKSLNTDYSNLEVMFGTTFANDFDIKDDYGALKGQSLIVGESKTISQTIQTGSESTGLLIQLFAGATGGQDNTLEVSNITITKLTEQAGGTPVDITVNYPGAMSFGSFEMRDNKGELSGNGSSAEYKCTSESSGGAWERGLFINDVHTLTAGEQYQISFDIAADSETPFEVAYNKDGKWGESEKAFGAKYELTATAETSTVTHTLTPEVGGVLNIRIDLGKAAQNTTVTVSNVTVAKYGSTGASETVSSVTYPVSEASAGSFEVRDLGAYDTLGGNPLSGDGESASFLCSLDSDWQRGFWIHTIATLTENTEYELSYKIKATGDVSYRICLGDDDNIWGGENYFGQITDQSVEAGDFVEVTHTIPNKLAGKLTPRFDVTAAATDTVVTIKDVAVRIAPSATVTYPNGTNAGTFEVRDPGVYDTLGGNPLSGDGSSASFLCSLDSDWQRGFWIHNIATLAENAEYELIYKLKATGNISYRICLSDEDNIWGGENYFGQITGLSLDENDDFVEVTHAIPNKLAGKLTPRFDITAAATDTVVTVKDVKVKMKTPVGTFTYPLGGKDSFEVRDLGAYDTLGGNPLSGDGASASFLCSLDSDWQRGYWIHNIASLTEGLNYKLSYKLKATGDITYRICLGDEDNIWGGENYFGQIADQSLTAGNDFTEVTHTIPNSLSGKLTPRFDVTAAATDTVVTIKDVTVETVPSDSGYTPESINVSYPALTPHSFEVRDDKGDLTGDGNTSATFTCTTEKGEGWQRGLFVNGLCTLTAGNAYKVRFNIKSSNEMTYDVCYNKDGNWGASEKAFGAQYGLTSSNEWSTAEYTINPTADGTLSIRLDLGTAENGTVIDVKDFAVEQISFTETASPITSFGSVWTEQNGCDVELTNNADNAVMKLTARDGVNKEDWRAKLLIDTGVIAEAGKGYHVSFDIQGTNAQSKFHVIYGYGGSGDHEKAYGERWNDYIAANTVKTITRDVYTKNEPGHPITILLLLGLLDGNENTLTISNVRVYENTVGQVASGNYGYTTAANVDMQPGYSAEAISEENSASLKITKTPSSGAEPWKMKLFVDTDVNAVANEWYRVSMDVTAERDMDFEICYNRSNTEKGFDAIYGLHAAAGHAKTIEKAFQASGSGDLILQLSLGTVPAPNTVTVGNLKVEHITFRYSGKSALPAAPVYNSQGDVTYWAHNDYNVALTGNDNAVTVNVKKAPSFGAEPWKIKLFLDTKAVLKPGRFYKVTTDLVARSPQNVEICYNNGGAEMGYDSLGGIRLAAGVAQTVEKLIAVPADMSDAKNLMLQVNLGAATSPNAITVSGITVEEVTLQYSDLMAGFSYKNGSELRLAPDYGATLEATDTASTIHVTKVSADAAVWKAQMLISTGVVLQPGKSYVVRANLKTAKDLTYEICFNNEETEKGFDVLYGQSARSGITNVIDKKISVPAGMTDAGELVLQFSVGGPSINDVTVSDLTVQEVKYGSAINLTPASAISPRGGLGLTVTREKLTGKISGANNAIRIVGADLCAGEQYKVAFTGKADAAMNGTLTLRKVGAANAAMTQRFELSAEEKAFAFTTEAPITENGIYELLWQPDNGQTGTIELSDIKLSIAAEQFTIQRSHQKVMVNGKPVTHDAYNIDGYNYFKLRELAVLLNDTNAQFVVRYNAQTRLVSVTGGKHYTPIGGELVRGADRSASCVRGTRNLEVNGKAVQLKAYNLGGNNYCKLRDLAAVLGFKVDYVAATDTVLITSPMTPEAQEASYAYKTFFRPAIDSESQPHVGDPMVFFENGTYYIYYLKEGGDSINHSVYLTTTTDFVHYTEYDKPVLAAAQGDKQDSWIGTGSVMKLDDTYYFFYTGHASSANLEFGETLLVAKSKNLTSFERVSGWEIKPPADLGQKRDFRDPQAYYDPATGTISLTVTASKDGVARVLKYTMDKNLQNIRYDGVIFTDPTGAYWNLECTDTFKIGNTWYLTYSGQEDTLWYATAASQYGPYSAPVQLDGKVFYAAKHVEHGGNTYMVGWARRSETASSTQEVAAWGGNLVVQKVAQLADGSLTLVPVDSLKASFNNAQPVTAQSIALTATSDYSYKQLCTATESFMLTGEFTYSGSGSFGLAFDFNGSEAAYKLVSVNPAEGSLSLSFNEGITRISDTPAKLGTKHSFTYIQDGSVGIFYVDGVASLVVRVYGSTGKPIYLFAENNSVNFTSLRCFTS